VATVKQIKIAAEEMQVVINLLKSLFGPILKCRIWVITEFQMQT